MCSYFDLKTASIIDNHRHPTPSLTFVITTNLATVTHFITIYQILKYIVFNKIQNSLANAIVKTVTSGARPVFSNFYGDNIMRTHNKCTNSTSGRKMVTENGLSDPIFL